MIVSSQSQSLNQKYGNKIEFEHFALENYKDIESNKTIPFGTTVLGEKCFYGCDWEIIDIPRTVKRLGDSCFMECKFLKEITIPNSPKRRVLQGFIFSITVFWHYSL